MTKHYTVGDLRKQLLQYDEDLPVMLFIETDDREFFHLFGFLQKIELDPNFSRPCYLELSAIAAK